MPWSQGQSQTLSFLLSLLSRLVAQWLSLIQCLGVPRWDSNSRGLLWHSIKVLLHNFCSTWLMCRRRTLCCHYSSDFWAVSKINSSWLQVPCTDGLLALWYPNWMWTSRQLSDQAWICPVNLPACRVTQSRSQQTGLLDTRQVGFTIQVPTLGASY